MGKIKKTYQKISMADIYLQSCIDCKMPASVQVYGELKGLDSNEEWLRSIAKRIEELK